MSELKFKEVCRFDNWLKTVVQSIYYSNNKRMSDAYDRIKVHKPYKRKLCIK